MSLAILSFHFLTANIDLMIVSTMDFFTLL